MPGQKTVALPEVLRRLLPAGSRIIVKIHYRGAGEAAKDTKRSRASISQRRRRARSASGNRYHKSDAVIPAGAGFIRSKRLSRIQDDAEAIAIRPRVNPLIVVISGDGVSARRIGRSDDMDARVRVRLAADLLLQAPVALPKGTRVEVIAYFDNSDDNRNNPNDPAKTVRWSDLTSDPLCCALRCKTSTLMIRSRKPDLLALN